MNKFISVSELVSSVLIISISAAQAAPNCPVGQIKTPPSTSINTKLTSPEEYFMKNFMGAPIVPSPSSKPKDFCYPESMITSQKLRKHLRTENVGPFLVRGLKPAIETLKKIFTEVKQEDPALYSQIKTDGMFCLRPKKKGSDFL